MDENAVSKIIVDKSIMIHRQLGPGLLESVYEQVLAFELARAGLHVDRQASMPLRYGPLTIEHAYRLDLLVEDSVLVEIKAVEELAPVHKRQLLTYLKLADKRLGLLLNFGAETMKQGITRLVNRFQDSTLCDPSRP